MTNFTYFDFQDLTEDEKKLSKLLHSNNQLKKDNVMPSKTSVNNILAYSKTLSVRKSDHLGFIENLLN